MAKKAKKVASFFAAALCMKAYAKTGKKRRAKKREKTEKLVPERLEVFKQPALSYPTRYNETCDLASKQSLSRKHKAMPLPRAIEGPEAQEQLTSFIEVNGKSLISDFLKATALKGIVNRTFSELSLAQFYLPTGICGADVPAGAEIKIQVRRIR